MRTEQPYSESITALIESIQEYLHLPDPSSLILMLATALSTRMEGETAWLMFVGPPSSGKSELLKLLLGIPNTHIISAPTERALISASSRKEKNKDSTGGILMGMDIVKKKTGHNGIIIAKDFTSVLDMHRDDRSKTLAAFREIYDGYWARDSGVDGGKSFVWQGKLGFLGAVTDSIDKHHSVLSSMGDRFIYYRTQKEQTQQDRIDIARKVMHRRKMTADDLLMLQSWVACILDEANWEDPPQLKTEDEDWILYAVDFTAQGRSAIGRDNHSREITEIYDKEAPGRLTGAFAQLFRAVLALGCNRTEAKQLLRRVAVDSIPKDRSRIIDILRKKPGLSISEMRNGGGLLRPESLVKRYIADLEALLIIKASKINDQKNGWKLTDTFHGICEQMWR